VPPLAPGVVRAMGNEHGIVCLTIICATCQNRPQQVSRIPS